jgi:hypothetical protein
MKLISFHRKNNIHRDECYTDLYILCLYIYRQKRIHDNSSHVILQSTDVIDQLFTFSLSQVLIIHSNDIKKEISRFIVSNSALIIICRLFF